MQLVTADIDGNTALWDAISAKHHSIFRILYHWAAISDPHTAGDLLCSASKRNNIMVMKELLKHGLHVDSRDRHGKTALRIAMAENHQDMVKLLVVNGADVGETDPSDLPSANLNEILQKREVGYRVTVPDALPKGPTSRGEEGEEENNLGRLKGMSSPRVSIYRGHPVMRRDSCCTEAGRLIRLPNSLVELKSIAGTLNFPIPLSSCSLFANTKHFRKVIRMLCWQHYNHYR